MKKERMQAIAVCILVIFIVPTIVILTWLASFCTFDLINTMRSAEILSCNAVAVILGVGLLMVVVSLPDKEF